MIIKKLFPLPILFIVILNIIFYAPVLHYFFISDDFYFLSFRSLTDALTPKSGFYHYNPIFWLLIFGIKSLCGLNPPVFHGVTLGIHLLNILAVYLLAKTLLKSNIRSLLTALLFSLFFANYEVVYWITGMNTSLMVLFYILGLISFIHYVHNKRLSLYFLFIVFFILAIFSHEYAVSLPVVCFFYWFLMKGKKEKLIHSAKLFIIPFITVIGLTFIKLIYTHLIPVCNPKGCQSGLEGYILKQTAVFLVYSASPLTVLRPSIFRVIQSFIKSFTYLLIPTPQLLDNLPKLILITLFVLLLGFVLYKSLDNKYRLFYLSWLVTSIIIFSVTSLPQARYFYFSSIPAILLIISIVSYKGVNWKYIYLIYIFFFGIAFLQYQKIHWGKSSLITKKVLAEIYHKDQHPSPEETIYFINLPDSINGPPWNAYLFRNGLDNALEIAYRQKIGPVKYYRTIPFTDTLRNDPYISAKELNSLKGAGNTIFIYQNESVRLL